MQPQPAQRTAVLRGLCVSLAFLAVLGASVRGVDLGFCLCTETRAEAVDTCCPPDAATAPSVPVAVVSVVEAIEQGFCVELRLAGAETMTDASRVSTGLATPRLPVGMGALLPRSPSAMCVNEPYFNAPRGPHPKTVPLRI